MPIPAFAAPRGVADRANHLLLFGGIGRANMKKGKLSGGAVAASATAAKMAKLQSSALRACKLLKAMANPTRLMVLCQIADGEKSVGELEQAVGLSQSGLSQHLAVLRSKKLVTTRRVRQTIFYSLASREAASVMDTLYDVFCRGAMKRSPVGAARTA